MCVYINKAYTWFKLRMTYAVSEEYWYVPDRCLTLRSEVEVTFLLYDVIQSIA